MTKARSVTNTPQINSTPGRLPQPVTLLDKARLCERLNISPRTVEYMVKAGSFPPPVQIRKHVYWSEIAVMPWQRRMFSAQESWMRIH